MHLVTLCDTGLAPVYVLILRLGILSGAVHATTQQDATPRDVSRNAECGVGLKSGTSSHVIIQIWVHTSPPQVESTSCILLGTY